MLGPCEKRFTIYIRVHNGRRIYKYTNSNWLRSNRIKVRRFDVPNPTVCLIELIGADLFSFSAEIFAFSEIISISKVATYTLCTFEISVSVTWIYIFELYYENVLFRWKSLSSSLIGAMRVKFRIFVLVFWNWVLNFWNLSSLCNKRISNVYVEHESKILPSAICGM